MAYEPKTWRLEEMKAGKVEATAKDPQTNGDLWQIWTVARTDEIDVLYGHVEKGNRTGAHTHPDANHYTCIVEGTAIVWMEGTIVEVSAGDVVNIPTGVLHDFGSTPERDVWVVDLTSPPFDPEKMAFQPERDAEISKDFDKAYAARG